MGTVQFQFPDHTLAMIGKCWKRVKDKKGHAPIKKNLKLVCKYCNIPLTLRYSIVFNVIPFNEMGYKCRRCGYFQRFDVLEESAYIKEIIERRNGSSEYVPTVKEWSEDEETARQLTGLGYFGGRGD